MSKLVEIAITGKHNAIFLSLIRGLSWLYFFLASITLQISGLSREYSEPASVCGDRSRCWAASHSSENWWSAQNFSWSAGECEKPCTVESPMGTRELGQHSNGDYNIHDSWSSGIWSFCLVERISIFLACHAIRLFLSFRKNGKRFLLSSFAPTELESNPSSFQDQNPASCYCFVDVPDSCSSPGDIFIWRGFVGFVVSGHIGEPAKVLSCWLPRI